MAAYASGRALKPAGNILVALFWCNFLAINVIAYLHTPKPSLLLFAALESVTIVLYLVRISAQVTSRNILDWLLALVGTLVVMLYRPTLSADFALGEVLTIVGAFFAIA